MSELSLNNRQRSLRLDLRLFRRIAENVLANRLGERPYELAVFIIGSIEMARINRQHLGHEGSTDVITFPYSAPESSEPLFGDIFICIDEAISQARGFGTTWQSELMRYFIHGLLHLEGYDDLVPIKRRVMKREENLLLRHLTRTFPLKSLKPALQRPGKQRHPRNDN